MNKIKILKDNHTGIIFDPRSGSHVLREFFSLVNDNTNAGELFNPSQAINEKFIYHLIKRINFEKIYKVFF